jgi:uncharacterized membrane protein (TIGR02234 family)
MDMLPRRELVAGLGLVLVGAAAALLASTQRWMDVAGVIEMTGTRGRQVSPAAFALGLVGIAGLVAVLATRRLGRRIVGVLVVLAGAGLVWASVWGRSDVAWTSFGSAPTDSSWTAWPWVSVTGGVLVALGGLLIVLRGGRWPAMSSRYDRPSGQARSGEDDTWRALDRGEDPTV